MEKLSDVLLQRFIRDIKAQTSWRLYSNLPEFLKQNGFYGILAGLDEYYSMHELEEVLEVLWDTVE